MRGLLDPKMDFVFKNIFGSEKRQNKKGKILWNNKL